MMRKWMKELLRYLHVLLIFTIIVPTIYILGMQRETGMIWRLYAAGYVLLIPFIVFRKAEQRSKNFLQYVLVGILMLLFMGIEASWFGRMFLTKETVSGYVVYVVAGTIVAALGSYSVRIEERRKQKARREMDMAWKERDSLFDKPVIGLSLWFVVIYVISKNFACPEMCNIALFSAIGYLLVAVSYRYLDETEEYLKMNHEVYGVRGIPYQRVFQIGKLFLSGYLCLILVASIPAIGTIENRQYVDFRQWLLERELDTDPFLAETQKKVQADPMQEVIESYGEPKETPIVMEFIFQVIGIVFLIFILGAVFRWIHDQMLTFAEKIEEDDDIIEMLDTEDEEEKLSKKRRFFRRTDGDRVRKEYRRYIRKHREDKPKAYETPYEIEVAAGVADTAEGMELHERYEDVRYGKKQV